MRGIIYLTVLFVSKKRMHIRVNYDLHILTTTDNDDIHCTYEYIVYCMIYF